MLDDRISEKLKTIYCHFGQNTQMKKLYEEIDEFLETLVGSDEWIEELADVIVIGLQHVLIHEYGREKVLYKIRRTLERMESGYYNTNQNKKVVIHEKSHNGSSNSRKACCKGQEV
jgi:predicted house-cleaning noncanonical NTP pyrophosphatase (MazG superfamily)